MSKKSVWWQARKCLLALGGLSVSVCSRFAYQHETVLPAEYSEQHYCWKTWPCDFATSHNSTVLLLCFLTTLSINPSLRRSCPAGVFLNTTWLTVNSIAPLMMATAVAYSKRINTRVIICWVLCWVFKIALRKTHRKFKNYPGSEVVLVLQTFTPHFRLQIL